ncbi:MAG TPA: hypothetical protein VI306_15285 [Pyrinomonadaceae bacterium]
MTDRKLRLTHLSRSANATFGSPAKLLKRLLIPALLLGALLFPLTDRPVVSVHADDCTSVNMSLSSCYTSAAGVSDFGQRVQAFGNCEFTHALAGATCSMPTHSPMTISGGGCDPAANGQRAYDNCMAGTLAGFWQSEYLNYMAYYNDMEISCAMIGQSVEGQGCY